jgi:hypothetical protein
MSRSHLGLAALAVLAIFSSPSSAGLLASRVPRTFTLGAGGCCPGPTAVDCCGSLDFGPNVESKEPPFADAFFRLDDNGDDPGAYRPATRSAPWATIRDTGFMPLFGSERTSPLSGQWFSGGSLSGGGGPGAGGGGANDPGFLGLGGSIHEGGEFGPFHEGLGTSLASGPGSNQDPGLGLDPNGSGTGSGGGIIVRHLPGSGPIPPPNGPTPPDPDPTPPGPHDTPPSAVPEPASLILGCLGAMAFFATRRRR